MFSLGPQLEYGYIDNLTKNQFLIVGFSNDFTLAMDTTEIIGSALPERSEDVYREPKGFD